jgi:diguanylate cyclase (GGDEF)-like protein/PAS domain S-box-containing protein
MGANRLGTYLAALLVPASLGERQALRLRRFGLAALTYALTTALVAISWSFGVLPGQVAAEVAAAYLAINVGLYATFRSGFNLRFADPSLTTFQMITATTVVMYLAYYMDDARDIALSGCFIVFLFGTFRMETRQFRLVTLYTLGAYALVLDLLMYLRPEAVPDVPHDRMSWLMLAGLLPCFAIVGGQVNRLRRKLRDSDARFRGLTQMSSDFYWESDAEHRLTQRGAIDHDHSSRASIFASGVKIGERRWESPSLSPDEAGWAAHRAVLDAHRPFRDFEFSRPGADGSERHVCLSGDPVFDAKGAFRGYHGVGTDITPRKRTEQALRDGAQELRMFADNMPAMTVSWDERLRCRFANKQFVEFYGLASTPIVGMHARDILGEEVYGEIEAHLAQVLLGYPVTYEGVRTGPRGDPRHVEVKLLPNVSEQGKVLGSFSVITDITGHKLAEKRILQVAHHDSLTGLPNRVLFDDRLQQAIGHARRNSRPIALLYLDLDRFKAVNDTLGHAAGDELLVAVAARIRLQVRESDTVARLGGDEFIVILPDVPGLQVAERIASKIAAALSTPFPLGSPPREADIGTSIGIAMFPDDGGDAPSLVKAADAAMYRAKQAQRDVPFAA